VRIKFCGGCNPDYDRVALAERIKDELGDRVEWVSSEEEPVDLVVAVQGCETACADLTKFPGCEIRSLTRPEDADALIRDMNTRASGQGESAGS
jgi:hypothetical protein